MIPVSGPITQGFGCTTFDNPAYPIVNGCRWHSGIDYEPGSEPPSRLLAPAGSPSLAGVTPNYGNVGDIDHANGLRSRYAHLFEVRVGPGQSVAEGDVIGLVGRTGNSTGLAGQRGWSLIRRTLESADLDLL